MEDLPNEIKIDCFSVSCVPVKNAIEQILQNLFDSLINCLRRSVQADLVAADAFLSGRPFIFRQYLTIFCKNFKFNQRNASFMDFRSECKFFI